MSVHHAPLIRRPIAARQPRPTRLRMLPRLLCLVICGLASCGGESAPSAGNNTAGSLLDHPSSSTTRSQRFWVDPNRGGQAPAVHISGIYWGRLVDVYDLDDLGERRLQHENYVIGADVLSNGQDVLLESNPVTGRQSLVVLYTRTQVPGDFERILRDLDRNLIPVIDQDLSEVELYTMVPRNAVLVVQLDDLLDPQLVNFTSVQTLVGNPPTVGFRGRILLDTNHGDLVEEGGVQRFYSTRILIDPTVSALEALEVDPPLDINGVGFPAAANINQANLALRFPTAEKESLGVDTILRNLRGNSLARTQNGTVDFASATIDVVRYMRSGGSTEVTGDSYNGFLRDEEAPRVVGAQPVTLVEYPVPDPNSLSPFDLLLPRIELFSDACDQIPAAGDVIVQSGIYAEIRRSPLVLGPRAYGDVAVRLLLGEPEEWQQTAVGVAQFLSAFEPEIDEGEQACFVGVLPLADEFPLHPNRGLSLDAVLSVRFSEPMDPASLTAFDSLILTRIPLPEKSSDYVVGSVQQSLDLAQFFFVPDLPLRHEQGLEERYTLSLASGQAGPTDLAGNPLASPLPSADFYVRADLASESNGGRVSRFASPDEEAPFGGDSGSLPEWTGQHLYDLDRGLIRPRPVVHFQGVADRNSPILSLLFSFGPGVQTPLSGLGSKMQTVWRYADVSFGLTDISTMNVDVEGLSWTPNGGTVIADHYNEFEMRLCHARRLPDEFVAQSTNLPDFPNSGLRIGFSENLLNSATDPQKIVHPKHLGYTVNPADAYAAKTGTIMVPWPLNRELPEAEYRYYTWRDTSLLDRAAPQGGGVDLHQLWQVLGIGTPILMAADFVTSIGLPLLIEVRCYPDIQAVGLNPHAILLGNLSSAQPNFRAFSTGGLSQTGVVVTVDPDTETTANGGFNPNSNPPGAPTNGVDNSVYLGAMDLVTRLSRSVSVWFDVGGSTAAQFEQPVVEPRPADLPAGTAVQLAFRGALVVEPAAAREDASALDLYGDYYDDPSTDRWHPNPLFVFQNGGQWQADISSIQGATYYQVRVTFIANPVSGVAPELSALAVAWRN